MTTDNNSKSPPWDQEAEQATLGAMLVEAGATKRAFSIVETEDFYSQVHQRIFSAVQAVYKAGEPVDLVTVAAELRRRGQLEEVGSGEYLTALIAKVPTPARLRGTRCL